MGEYFLCSYVTRVCSGLDLEKMVTWPFFLFFFITVSLASPGTLKRQG